MLISEMTEGLRVKIVKVIDMFPVGIFLAGLTGTVCDICAFEDATLLHVELDEHQPNLDGWENKIQVYSNDECGWSADNFEPI